MRVLLVVLSLIFTSCATTIEKPCTGGGEPPRPSPVPGTPPFEGTKQCSQLKDTSGKFVNHGPYIEWYPNHKRALVGEYRAGRKHGKWSEWDDTGKLLYEKFYEDGTEIPNAANPPSPAGAAGSAAASAQAAAAATAAGLAGSPAAVAGAAAAAAAVQSPSIVPVPAALPSSSPR